MHQCLIAKPSFQATRPIVWWRSGVMSILCIAWSALALPTPSSAQSIVSPWREQLNLTNIGQGILPTRSRTTQMAMIDGPQVGTRYLYFSSEQLGIRRAVYEMATRSLVAGSLEDVATDIRGLGIAFHGSTLYASEPYVSDLDGSVDLSRIWRIEDLGTGARTEIVQGIPRQDHGVNHIQIVGDSLYVGIGVRTRNGAFQTWSGDDHGESAYGGSIGVIDDLNQVGSETNAAGFYPAHPTTSAYRSLINGQDPVSANPFTTTDPGKLRIHSSGTRNPFGVAVDGDNHVWFTNNSQRTENDIYDRNNLDNAEGDAFGNDGFQDDIHDQMFRIAPKADYGYRNGNWQDGNAAGNTAATDAGFFAAENRMASFTFDNYVDPVAANETDGQDPEYNQDYVALKPSGLGPSSSSNGLAFYQGNEMPLALHHDAFVARWNGSISDGGDRLTYRDVVSVDSATGEVRRIAANFQNPLDVIEDGQGNLIVADYGGSIYVISAAEPHVGAHAFSWDSDQAGNWSDRLMWNAASMDENDRMVPHQWGSAQYAVTIDRPNSDVTVHLDQDASIDSVRLAEKLILDDGHTLIVNGEFEVSSGGRLSGGAIVQGEVVNRGELMPGSMTSRLMVTEFIQHAEGRLLVDLISGVMPMIEATRRAQLDGELAVEVELESLVRGERRDMDIVSSPDLAGEFASERINDRLVGASGHVQNGYFLRTSTSTTTAQLSLYAALPGDADGDGLFNSGDLISVLQFGEYEDGVPGNSEWTEGDWDGNQDFETTDLIVALETGKYEVGPASMAPEPGGVLLLGLALGSLLPMWRGRR